MGEEDKQVNKNNIFEMSTEQNLEFFEGKQLHKCGIRKLKMMRARNPSA